MNRLIRTGVIFFLPAIFFGCSNMPLYRPTNPPVSLSTEPWQLSASGFYGSSGMTGRAGLTFPDHIQVTAAYTKVNFASHSYEAKEALAGFYYQFDDFVFEAFGGVGEGEGWNSMTTEEFWNFQSVSIERKISGKTDRKILQVNLGRKPEPYRVGLFLRASEIQTHDVVQTHSKRGIEYSGSPNFTLFEPGIFAGVGKKTLFYYMMAMFPMTKETLPFYISPFVFSLGVMMQIGF